jgi:hypothetical protein
MMNMLLPKVTIGKINSLQVSHKYCIPHCQYVSMVRIQIPSRENKTLSTKKNHSVGLNCHSVYVCFAML